jgi:transcription antitermination factor NusG
LWALNIQRSASEFKSSTLWAFVAAACQRICAAAPFRQRFSLHNHEFEFLQTAFLQHCDTQLWWLQEDDTPVTTLSFSGALKRPSHGLNHADGDSEKKMNATLAINLEWYALRVYSKYEGRVSIALRAKGYEEFLPLSRKRHHWRDRVKESDAPLFPGYVFCRVHIGERLLPILTTPGVMGFVGAGRVPTAISDQEIAAVQSIVNSGLPSRPSPFVCLGSVVILEDGPLKGIEGIVVRTDKECRLVVSVSLLQRSVEVEVERDWIRPVSQCL